MTLLKLCVAAGLAGAAVGAGLFAIMDAFRDTFTAADDLRQLLGYHSVLIANRATMLLTIPALVIGLALPWAARRWSDRWDAALLAPLAIFILASAGLFAGLQSRYMPASHGILAGIAWLLAAEMMAAALIRGWMEATDFP